MKSGDHAIWDARLAQIRAETYLREFTISLDGAAALAKALKDLQRQIEQPACAMRRAFPDTERKS